MYDEPPATVDMFCQRYVQPLGEESDHLHIVAITDALQVGWAGGRASRVGGGGEAGAREEGREGGRTLAARSGQDEGPAPSSGCAQWRGGSAAMWVGRVQAPQLPVHTRHSTSQGHATPAAAVPLLLDRLLPVIAYAVLVRAGTHMRHITHVRHGVLADMPPFRLA